MELESLEKEHNIRSQVEEDGEDEPDSLVIASEENITKSFCNT